MDKHHAQSIAFKRQVVEEHLAGETLHAAMPGRVGVLAAGLRYAPPDGQARLAEKHQ